MSINAYELSAMLATVVIQSLPTILLWTVFRDIMFSKVEHCFIVSSFRQSRNELNMFNSFVSTLSKESFDL